MYKFSVPLDYNHFAIGRGKTKLVCCGSTLKAHDVDYSYLRFKDGAPPYDSSPYIDRDAICPNLWRESSAKTCPQFV